MGNALPVNGHNVMLMLCTHAVHVRIAMTTCVLSCAPNLPPFLLTLEAWVAHGDTVSRDCRILCQLLLNPLPLPLCPFSCVFALGVLGVDRAR